MRLLSKKEVSGARAMRRDFDIERKVKVANEYKSKLQEINNLRGNLDVEKLKAVDDLNNFTEKCRIRKSRLTSEVKDLEDRKKTALEPVEPILEEAENIKNEAIGMLEKNKQVEKENEEKDDKIKEKENFVEKKTDELVNRELIIRDIETETKSLNKKARNKILKLADDIELFDEKKEKEDRKNLKEEKEIKNKKFMLKNEREAIDKYAEETKRDRLHLQSQIETFNLAKNEYTGKSKN